MNRSNSILRSEFGFAESPKNFIESFQGIVVGEMGRFEFSALEFSGTVQIIEPLPNTACSNSAVPFFDRN